MNKRLPIVWLGNGLGQLPDSDRLLYDIDLGGNRHYRGAILPLNPQINDTWDEETAGGLWVRTWFWNGTYWLSTQEFWKDNSIVSLGATAVIYYDLPSSNNVFMSNFKVSMLLGATNNASNNWTFALSRATGLATSTGVVGGSISTAAQAPNVWYTALNPINAHIDIAATNSKAFRVDANRVGAPSNVTGGLEISYRLARI